MAAVPDRSDRQVSLFATTRWSIVGAAAGDDDTLAREGLAALFETYWAPLYRYVRRLGQREQDAEDLVQGFFASLLEGRGLRLADPQRGRFRAFMLASLKHYMANEWRREHRQKRGGFAQHLSIDWKDAETGLSLDPADERSPDKLYDREWAMALLDKVLDELAAEEEDFGRWKPFLSVSSGSIRYAEIAEEFGMTEGAARVAVHRLRKRYRHRLREEIGRTLVNGEMVEEEMASLFAALAE
ncbi:RNA polymerase sigma factor [Luteolibacter sp. GHJ8]|uniref:RNA polymerase sigma factor n=1 Tax=Luteolibacter rhizosphaerae TaxID=2989719 RepID=A0ABT3FXR4_9BACT|nr:RNA polymerase sigma factor [Luteolibacter rhizosphaerae]MCW1912044.1 RNA polymerase sigma factor [Luteolibacter rhizosphaerae]